VTYRPLVPWQVLERRTLVERRWMVLHEDRVKLANGREISEFHVIEQPSWAGILCITKEDEVVLARQYRHGITGETLELPAGVVELPEAPLAGAQRELREETGYAAERWEPIGSFACDPSRQSAYAHFFCALDATPTAARALDESEDIDVVRVPRTSLFGLVEAGKIIHGQHVAAILLAARRGLIEL
jgi:ADP-ribose pyrophosphatase